jgi:hypothetical protein
MKKLLLLAALTCAHSILAISQTYEIAGTLKDASTGEPLIGATVSTGAQGTVTDETGAYALSLPSGTYTLAYSYVGYVGAERSIQLDRNLRIDIELSTIVLQEVVVVADIARDRETPVAFSNIPSLKLKEELASRDIVMVLNTTPGAYATQSGGGDGDARVTIRGFNQRNVAVMINGIPVNDMENGWVYWSNWFGLDLVTQTMQVQRGLGASKLSIPSVGGTINILTKGIDSRREMTLRQEVGNDGFLRTVAGLSTGRMKNGWAVSAAGSYKQGDGWVDGNFTEGWFYYLRIDKQLGKHLLSLQGFGAPQKHGQRSFQTSIQTVDAAFAEQLGVPKETISNPGNYLGIDRGRRFNQHWGLRDGELFNTQQNFYHKPQFSLRHSWQANEKFFWSNIGYLSIGNGGGTSTEGRFQTYVLPDGQLNLDTIVVLNKRGSFLKPAGKSERILRASMNNHFWYGILSTLQYTLGPNWKISGGIDGRYYRGDHFRKVYDLLGGDYFIGPGNTRIDSKTTQLAEGDKYDFDNSGFVRWLGGFGLLELKTGRWSAFLNLSAATTGYSLEDYMKPKVVRLADTTLYVSYGAPATYLGTTYTLDSPEARNQKIDWVSIPSYTFKTGASYDISQHHTVFFNTGYLSKAQRFNNVINDGRNNPRQPLRAFSNFENEKILAGEGGYSFRSPIFSANVNAYITYWQNKPLDFTVSAPIPDNPEETVPVNIPGIDALHTGLEIDFAIKPLSNLTIEGLASIGDWKWNSSELATIYLEDYDTEIQYEFDAKGVHVGDAAQLQFGGMVRYEPVKGLFLKVRSTFFGKNFSNFSPESLRGDSGGRDSWRLPDYTVFDGHAGYSTKIGKTRLSLNFNLLNIFDTTFITDATNNDTRSPGVTTLDFDAKSAGVHFGLGRQWNLSLQAGF